MPNLTRCPCEYAWLSPVSLAWPLHLPLSCPPGLTPAALAKLAKKKALHISDCNTLIDYRLQMRTIAVISSQIAATALGPHNLVDSWKVEPSLDAVKRPGTKATNASVLQ